MFKHVIDTRSKRLPSFLCYKIQISRASSRDFSPGSGDVTSSGGVAAACPARTRGSSLGDGVPFQRARRGTFFQQRPRIGNVYLEDAPLQSYLQRLIPQSVLAPIADDLVEFGQRVTDEITALGLQCEENPPYVKHFDAWGNRVDELVTCEAWRKQKCISAEEGIVAIPYENGSGQYSRLHQAAKMIMYSPSSGLYSCPLAMTDGAAKVFQKDTAAGVKRNAFARLTSRDPNQFWTSGQWMTERRGGSDVGGGTETLAYPQEDGSFRLHGYKWFSSATDCDMTLALARAVNEDGQIEEGTKGLSLFYLETRNPAGGLNGMEIHKLKDKLGTRQLPTAELLLDGTVAHLVSALGHGVSSIAPMLTITRFHNAVSAVGYMRRIMHYARDYSFRRKAFGKLIVDWPLHMQTLSRMEVETRGAMLLVLESARLLGRQEAGEASEDELHLLRLIVPVLKLYTGKQAVSVTSEGLESIGGQGYIEDTGFPAMLRDAQVLSIWEGTTNILSLDVLRSIIKTRGQTMETFFRQVRSRLAPFLVSANNPDIGESAKAIELALDGVAGFLADASDQDPGYLELAARDFAYSIARTYTGLLLLEHAAWEHAREDDIAVAKRWCQQDLCPISTHQAVGTYSIQSSSLDYRTVMTGYQQKDWACNGQSGPFSLRDWHSW